MTPSQQSTLQRLTNRFTLYYNNHACDEFVGFRIEALPNGTIMLIASNSGAPWFVTHRFACIHVGARGGINKKIAQLENFAPSLIF